MINKDSSKKTFEHFVAFVEVFCENLFTPLSVGGGIREFEQAQKLFSVGVDKVIISYPNLSPGLAESLVKNYGGQALAISFDYLESLNPQELLNRIQDLNSFVQSFGIGELIVNNVSRDGSGRGLDIDRLNLISKMAVVPIVAGCGVNGVLDIAKGYLLGS